jgi:hypothetical protein
LIAGKQSNSNQLERKIYDNEAINTPRFDFSTEKSGFIKILCPGSKRKTMTKTSLTRSCIIYVLLTNFLRNERRFSSQLCRHNLCQNRDDSWSIISVWLRTAVETNASLTKWVRLISIFDAIKRN